MPKGLEQNAELGPGQTAQPMELPWSDFKVEMPSGTGTPSSLWDVSLQLSRRLVSIFEFDPHGKRPVHDDLRFAADPLWRDWIWFFEYFDGETGRGLGASHQTGWTALVAKLIDQLARHS